MILHLTVKGTVADLVHECIDRGIPVANAHQKKDALTIACAEVEDTLSMREKLDAWRNEGLAHFQHVKIHDRQVFVPNFSPGNLLFWLPR